MTELIDKYSSEIVSKLKDNLEALILVGSFSRGEGIEDLSDIEFWAVVKDLSKAEKPKLNDNASLGFTTRKHLKRLKPYIYTVEVKKFGKVLCGDKNILNLIPDYSFTDINPIDGFILLNNRLVEQLILLNKIEEAGKINQYEFDKAYVQLVNSLLVVNRSYKSLYPEKQEEFHKIFRNNNYAFLDKINVALTSIRQPSKNLVNKTEALNYWLEVREYFKKTWAEETKTLGKIKCWVNVLGSGRPEKFFIYQKASKLYFSDNYQNKESRNNIIKNWERLVK